MDPDMIICMILRIHVENKIILSHAIWWQTSISARYGSKGVAQLVNQSLPTPDNRGSNPDISKTLSTNCSIEKTKIVTKRRKMARIKKVSFSFISWLQLVEKHSRLESNCGPLVPEANAQPTDPSWIMDLFKVRQCVKRNSRTDSKVALNMTNIIFLPITRRWTVFYLLPLWTISFKKLAIGKKCWQNNVAMLHFSQQNCP